MEGYARLLAVAPNDPNAVAGLERLLGLPAVRPDAARLLEPVYRSLNDVRHLVDVLELRLSGAPPNDRVPSLEEIANLREALGQRDLAFAARVRAFGEMPESAGPASSWSGSPPRPVRSRLAAAYRDQLERGVTNATSTELWRRLAVLWGGGWSGSTSPPAPTRSWPGASQGDPGARGPWPASMAAPAMPGSWPR